MSRAGLLNGTALSILAAVAFGTPAMAQEAATDTNAVEQTDGDQNAANGASAVVALDDWNYDDIYAEGWSVEKMFDDTSVIGPDGEDIGGVENILVDEDGRIVSVIAEIGGFLDIGDTHVSVPWDEVEISDDLEQLTIPVTEENVDDYSLFGDGGYFVKPEGDTIEAVSSELQTGPRVWKTTELLDDYVLLSDAATYGYVNDLIFTGEGMLQAVVVDPDVTYRAGPYAMPYYGYAYGWQPSSTVYVLPYAETDLSEMESFDYGEMSNMGGTDSGEDTTQAN